MTSPTENQQLRRRTACPSSRSSRQPGPSDYPVSLLRPPVPPSGTPPARLRAPKRTQQPGAATQRSADRV
eukprot:6296604-Pyramimonas_sp.AAC.2